jgi:aspartate aminotransferase-like enzyme
MPQKRYLVTPGPTPVPPQVLQAMSAPIIHHRAHDFRVVLARLLERLPEIFRTENDVLMFASSGTGAMESAVANICSPDDRVLVVSAGHFGERWAEIVSRYRCDVVHLALDWGETPSADDVEARIAEVGGVKAVYLTQCETSTGVVTDVRAIAERAESAGALVVVDAISSLGAIRLETDEWGVDVVVSGSQKALMTPPGLALASVSGAAVDASLTATSPRFYFDWERARKFLGKRPPEAQFTPAISLVVGLDAAVSLLLEEGLEAAFDRHVRLGRACRAGVKAMGLELFSPDEDRSAVVTAIRMPDAIDGQEIVRFLREREGVTIAGGQGHLRGKVIRIGHIGYVDVFDVTTALAGLEVALVEAGADVERGVAVTAALEAYGEPARV